MAKKSEKPKRAPVAKAPGSIRRLTHTTVMGDAAEGSYKVYGIARKSFVQNSTFGRVPGLKGVFEAITPDGKTLTSKRAFLPAELHAQIVSKLTSEKRASVVFGVEAKAKGEEVSASFFMDPALTDPMAQVREAAASA